VRLTRFALHRPVTVLMAFTAIIIFGLISWQRLPLQLMPTIDFPQLTVLTTYENVAPPEIEELVSKPIEEAVGTVTGVKRIASVSKEGVSIVTADFDWGTDIDIATLNVREKVDLIKGSLPRDIEYPIIVKYDPSSAPIMTLGISGRTDLPELTKIAAEQIKPRLERIKGVAIARLSGAVEREIHVSVDQGRLYAYRIPLSAVVEKLRLANFNFPGGKIEEANNEIRIRTIGKFDKVADIENVVLSRQTEKSPPIFIRDVAAVQDTLKEKTSSFTINNKESIGISIFKQADGNTVEIAKAVLELLDELQPRLGEKANMRVVYNQSSFIQNALSDLQWAGVVGGVLAFLVLFLFLGSFRSAIVITTAIPISVIGAFSLMYSSGLTLNMMSLGGLALGVGLLVDNGIVILENIHRKKETGVSGEVAILNGAAEMQNPVLASTFAHIIVFLPIIFVHGMAGKFFFQLALTISFSLLMSILVALLLNPVLESQMRLGGSNRQGAQTPFWGSILKRIIRPVHLLPENINRGIKTLETLYVNLLLIFLKKKKTLLFATLLVLAASVLTIPLLGKEFIPYVDQGNFLIKVTTPHGSSLPSTEAMLMKMGKILSQEPEVKDLYVNIGYDRNDQTERALGETQTNVALINVILDKHRKRPVTEFVDDIRNKLSAIDDVETEYILNQDIANWIKQKTPEILQISGTDPEIIKSLTKQAVARLKRVPYLKDVQSDIGEEESEIRITVNREKASLYKLNVKAIADTVKLAIDGDVASKYQDANQEVDIRVRLRDQDRSNISKVGKLLLHTPLGTDIPLEEVASLVTSKRLPVINRRDMSKVAVLSANITGTTYSKAIEKAKYATADLDPPPDHFITFSDQHQEVESSFKDLAFALSLSILLVYMLLASLFESLLYPFIIMFAVPPAIIGVVLILFITGASISLGVYIGTIMLCGIVVNNSIILVDYTDSLRKKGLHMKAAVIEAGRVRLRPIIMTAMTTILGLAPLAMGFGSGSEIRSPLAITVIGGLASSTFMTLIIVPVIYSIFGKLKTFRSVSLN